MDSDTIVFLVIAGFVVFIVGSWIFQWKSGYLKMKYQEGYDSVARPALAQRIAAGDKPWGAPFAGSTFGGAYFLDTNQLAKAGMAGHHNDLLGSAPFLGAHETKTNSGVQSARIYYPGDDHLITIAPTRKGKGVSHVIPNLIGYDGSVFVIDVKGENSRKTAEWRKSQNQDVFVFQPFEPSGNTHQFNPLDFIRPGPDAYDDAIILADMIVIPSDKHDEKYWTSEARNVIAGFLLHVALDETNPKRRNLAEVRRLLMLGKADFFDTLYEMAGSSREAVKHTANSLISAEEKLRSSILATAKNQTEFLQSERVTNAMTRSDWKFEQLKLQPTSIYIVIPPDKLETHNRVLRLMVGIAVAAMSRVEQKPQLPVLFLLDEFTQLGRMDKIANGVKVLASYGIRMWFFVQDLPSVRDVYGHDQALSFFANCGCKSFFGVSDFETAQHLSSQIGDMTVIAESQGHSNREGGFLNTDVSRNYSTSGRPLLTPEEILNLPPERQIILVSGQKPILAWREKYFEMATLEKVVSAYRMSAA